VVVGHLVVADPDRGGHGGEQRPRPRVRQRRRGHAADLQPGRHVGQQRGLGGRIARGQPARGRLGGHHAFGHEELREPAPQLAALAGAAGGQRGTAGTVAQSRLGRVELIDRDRRAGDGGNQVDAHVTVTVTAGE
jgi:hypothetical protein